MHENRFVILLRNLLADHSISKSAMENKDSRILAISSREIAAAKACCTTGRTARAILGLRQA